MPRRPMIVPTLIASLAAMSLAPCVQAVEIWHNNTMFAGQGMCSATFEFHSQMRVVHDLRVEVSVLDADGGAVQSGTLSVDRLGDTPIDHNARTFLEGERLCEPGLSMRIDSATATIDGKTVDLVAAGQFAIREFEAWPIRLD